MQVQEEWASTSTQLRRMMKIHTTRRRQRLHCITLHCVAVGAMYDTPEVTNFRSENHWRLRSYLKRLRQLHKQQQSRQLYSVWLWLYCSSLHYIIALRSAEFIPRLFRSFRSVSRNHSIFATHMQSELHSRSAFVSRTMADTLRTKELYNSDTTKEIASKEIASTSTNARPYAVQTHE